MEQFWQNEYIQIAAYYSVVVLCLVLFLAVFELVTKYDDWEEVKKGNMAVAMATGGKILGIANIFRYTIIEHSSVLAMIGWGVYGFALLLCGYFIFEFLSPKINVDEEIEKGNWAVGFISMVISIGLSFIIGSGI